MDSRSAKLAEVRKERQLALAKQNKDFSARDQRLKARRAGTGRTRPLCSRPSRKPSPARPVKRGPAPARTGRRPREAQHTIGHRQTHRKRAAGQLGATYGGPFASAKGKLPWPVNGRLVARYGTPRGEDARTKWDGVLIGAAAGSQVRAVHGGRVVFADWLRVRGFWSFSTMATVT